VSRRIADAGADAIVLPAAWVPGPLKEHHWETLINARAIENTLYVLASRQTSPGGIGASRIVDPMGVTLAALGENEGVTAADLTSERIAEVRHVNPALALRRFTTIADAGTLSLR
jgi:predicted amidohydrolase